MRRTKLTLLAVLLVASATSYGQFDIGNIYPVEKSHSYVEFSITYMGYAEVRGGFGDFGGTILYDPQRPESTSVTFRVGVASIDTDTDWRDRDLQSPGWFGAEEFPEITFVSSSAKVQGNQLLVVGDLTIKDVTKEITVTMVNPKEVLVDNRDDEFVIFKGAYSLDRKEYNVLGKRWDQVKAGIASLSNEVTVQFSLLGKQIKKGNLSNWLRNPRSPQHHIYNSYNEEGVTGAFAQYELMKDTMDINEGALNIVGYMLLAEKKVGDAILILEKNAQEFSDKADALASMGEALVHGKREDEATEYFEKVLALDPNNTHAREILRHL